VAVFGQERGMRPREVARILVDHRAELRRCYRDTLAVLPESAFAAEWVKSRGAMGSRRSHLPGLRALMCISGSPPARLGQKVIVISQAELHSPNK
jgi:hypothetical protein